MSSTEQDKLKKWCGLKGRLRTGRPQPSGPGKAKASLEDHALLKLWVKTVSSFENHIF